MGRKTARRRRIRADRKKTVPTPRRPRRQQPPRPRSRSRPQELVVVMLAQLCVAAAGVAMLVFCGADLAFVTGWTGSPRLAMTIESCETHQKRRGTVTNCSGSGEPRAGAVDHGWVIHGAHESYGPGAVVPVRCHRDAECEETGAAPVALDLVGMDFGLATVSGLVLGGLVILARERPVPRLAPLATARRRRAVVGWFGLLGAAAIVLLTVYAAA